MHKSLILFVIMLLVLAVPVFADSANDGFVNADQVNFRSAPELSATVITVLNLGDTVTIVESQKPWIKVCLADQSEGWLYEKYVTVGTPDNRALLRGGREVVSRARSYMGTRYIYGGGSTRGFDCSGFTMYIYRQLGVELPHNAAAQAGTGVSVARENLRQGDLVFFATLGSKTINHVGIYIGDGQFIHASSGYGAVRVSPLSEGYYATRYRGARRVLDTVPDLINEANQ